MIAFVRQQLSRYLTTSTSQKKLYTYVAIGDSATEGIGATSQSRTYPYLIFRYIQKHHKNAEFHNFGVRRSPASWVIANQLVKAIELQPDLITLSVGANDIRVKNMPWKFESELRHLIRELKENTHATIVINSIPDFTHTKWVPLLLKPVVGVAIKTYNNVIEKVAKEENILFVDLYHQASVFTLYPEITGDDGFHPSDFGYALWANSILGHLQQKII